MLCSRPALIERESDGFFKYRLDIANLAVPDDVAAICVSRPTNPSGNVLTIAELEQLDAAARQRGVPLVIDAAYGLPFPGLQFEDGAAFWNDNVILCLSLSKLGLPGARTGIVVAHESVIEAITAFIDGWNDRCQPFVWTKDADTIIAKAHRQPTSGTRH